MNCSLNPVKKVNLLFTDCNLTCPMCSMNANKGGNSEILKGYPGASQGRLELEDYRKFFAEIKKYRPIVSIAGGEPMLYRDIVPLVRFIAGECNLPVAITSNGTLLKESIIEELSDLNIGFTFSVDGLERTHDTIRGKGTFKKVVSVIEGIALRKKRGFFKGQLSSLFVLHHRNYMDLKEVVRILFESIGIDYMTVSFLIFSTAETINKHNEWVRSRGLPYSYRIDKTKGDISENRAEILGMNFGEIYAIKEAITKKYSNIRFEPDFKDVHAMKRYFLGDEVLTDYFGTSCNPAGTNLTLLSNGDVLFYPGCFELLMGNIRETPVQSIWNSSAYGELRDVLADDLSPICSHCCANRVEKKL